MESIEELAETVEEQKAIIAELSRKLDALGIEGKLEALEEWEAYKRLEIPIDVANDALIGKLYRLTQEKGTR